MNDIITLVTQSITTDDYGDSVATESTRDVFCKVASIGTKEFYEANASGLRPEIKFIIADYLDYGNEKVVNYGGTRYSVLRTYRNGLQMEITCYREVNA